MRTPMRRLVRRPGEPSTSRRATSAFAARLAGSVVGVAGITLMGAGTFGSPAGVLADGGEGGGQSITGISESCAQAVTTGFLTVSNPVAGDTVTLQVYAHKPGSGTYDPTGATETITMVSGQTSYSYTISGVPASFSDGTVSGSDSDDSAPGDTPADDYNTWRVQVDSTTGSFSGDTTTKTVSYDCTGAAITTTSSTTTTQSTSSATTSTTSHKTTTVTDPCTMHEDDQDGTTCTTTSSHSTTSTDDDTTSTASHTTSATSSTSSSTPTTTSSSSTNSSSSTTSGSLTTTSTESNTSSTSKSTSSESSTSNTSNASGATTTLSSVSSTSDANPSTGVLGASTTAPSTGADIEFGFGIALLLGGAGVMIGATRINRNKRQ